MVNNGGTVNPNKKPRATRADMVRNVYDTGQDRGRSRGVFIFNGYQGQPLPGGGRVLCAGNSESDFAAILLYARNVGKLRRAADPGSTWDFLANNLKKSVSFVGTK